MGIIKSINELRWAKKAEETSTGTSLVVVKQQAVTAKYGDFGYTKLKNKNARSDAYTAGIADGKKVNVSIRAVAAPASAALLLR